MGNDTLSNFAISAASQVTAITVYTPFHYFQNRIVQQLPINPTPRVWFRGLPSMALGKVPTFAVQRTAYEYILQMKNTETEGRIPNELIAATGAGGASGVIANLTHQIALHQENNGTKLKQTMQKIVQSNGGFKRGLGVSISRESGFAAIYMAFFPKAQKSIEKKLPDSPLLSALAGYLFLGTFVGATTQPFMAVQATLFADAQKKEYANGFDAAISMARKNGFKTFYKGIGHRTPGIIFGLFALDKCEKGLHALNNY